LKDRFEKLAGRRSLCYQARPFGHGLTGAAGNAGGSRKSVAEIMNNLKDKDQEAKTK
jgi:hypothetical protein